MKVSVYLITYNRLELLKRAIFSVQSQSYNNIELIVVDDNSNDGTREFLTSYVPPTESHIEFKYFLNPKNMGACFSRNKAIKFASGEFITGLDDDDYFLHSRIDDFIQHWKKKDDDTIFIYSEYKILGEKRIQKTKHKQKVNRNDMLRGNHVGNQIFTSTKNLINIGGFDERFPCWQDFECWYRLLDNSYAENTGNPTYVVDQSHEHERISTSKVSKVHQAYRLMRNKYDLSEKDAYNLKAQELNIDFNMKAYFECLAYSVKHLDIQRLILLQKILFVKVIFTR